MLSVKHRLFSDAQKITLMFIEAVISGTCLSLFQSVFTYDFEQAKRVQNK